MNTTIRLCLFFEEQKMTSALRRFFLTQRDCVITDFFTDNHSLIRDIAASSPHIVIIQFALITANEKKILQAVFPNTIISTWADSKLDQDKFDQLIQMFSEKPEDGFIVNREILNEDDSEIARKDRNYSLTNRELQVLQLFSDGKSHQIICDELNISYETIRTHVQHIYGKMKVKRISEAVAKALRENLVK